MSYKFLDPFNTEAYADIMRSEGYEAIKISNTFLYAKTIPFGIMNQIYYPVNELSDVVTYFFDHYPQMRKILEVQGLLSPLIHADRTDYTFTVHVDLERSLEEIEQSLSKEKRWGIRKAVERGATCYIGKSIEDFIKFYAIYSLTAERQSIPKRSYDYLFKIFQKQDLTKLFMVEAEKLPIGAYMVLHSHELARFFYGGFLYEYRKFHPNELGHWTIIQHFREQGLKIYDVGGAGKNPQPSDFKVGWGSMVKIYRCQFYSSKFLAYALDCYRKTRRWMGKH